MAVLTNYNSYVTIVRTMNINTIAVSRMFQVSPAVVRELAITGAITPVQRDGTTYWFDYTQMRKLLPIISELPQGERTIGLITELLTTRAKV